MTLDDAYKKLSAKGYKLTPQRRLILKVINGNSHLNAKEVFKKVKESHPNCSFGTVYRNLNILAGLELIKQLDFKDGCVRYEILNHHHHLICLDCGGTIEIGYCPLDSRAGEIAKFANFEIKYHDFEIYGYCKKCLGKQKKDLEGAVK